MDAPQHPALAKLQALLGEVAVREAHGETTIILPAERLLDAARLLRDEPDPAYNQLADLTAVDRLHLDGQPRFVVVYHLLSHPRRERLRLCVPVPSGDEPAIASVVPLWPTANWLEREVYDMFGICFDGHPDLRRILMPDDWEGHPLRKDYPIGLEEVEFTHTIGHVERQRVDF